MRDRTLKDNDAVIVDCARTPMARSKNGVFRHVRAEDLSATLIDTLLEPSLDLVERWIRTHRVEHDAGAPGRRG